MTHEYIVQLPAGNKTPFTFLEVNWNPAGHEGVYQDVPHFDFHFYTVPKSVRDGIVPTDPDFATRANNLPAKEYIPHFWEPMITRAHILEKKTTEDAAVRDQLIPLPLPEKYQVPGYYPAAYRITWDAAAKEYRIALTELAWPK